MTTELTLCANHVLGGTWLNHFILTTTLQWLLLLFSWWAPWGSSERLSNLPEDGQWRGGKARIPPLYRRALLPLTGDVRQRGSQGQLRLRNTAEQTHCLLGGTQGTGLPQSPGLVAPGDEKTLATTVLTSSPQLLFLIVNEVKRQR